MVVQFEILNFIGAPSLLKSKKYILDRAIIIAKFTFDFFLGHAEYLGGVNDLDSIGVGDSIVLCLSYFRWFFNDLGLLYS